MSKKNSRFLALILCVMLLISVFPMSALADYNAGYQSETHTVFKHTEQTLAPGVTNYTNYAYSSDGKQMVYYVTTADLNRDDVVAQVAYKNMQNDEYGMDKLSNMVACANAKYSDPNNPAYISDCYTVVSACNGDGYNMTTGEPSGVFIMGGNIKKDWNKSSDSVFLAILKDGSAVIDDSQEAWNACKNAGIQEAIDVFGSNLVWDGKDVTANASGSYNTDRHSRTMVGVTSDGKLVICVVDGRQEPFSCGASMHELAQIMIEAGCVRAFNLDGGGSTTFMAKNEGSNTCKIQNRPSDGSERSISNGIIIASTAVPSDSFDHVSMSANDEYLMVGSSTAVTVAGVSPAGTSAAIPDDVSYETTNGTFENGILTATSTGDVVITAKQGEKAVGSVTVHCVVPDKIKFSSENFIVPYGKTAAIGMIATYGLNEVVTNAESFSFKLENEAAGSVDGMSFTACDENSGITGTTITASLVGTELTASAGLVFGKGSDVIFDFEDGTTNGFETGYGSYNYYLPNGGTFVANAENGKVHSGNYSLGVNIDYTNSWESGYQMNALYRITPEGETGKTDFVGANKIGCWIYIPDEYVGLWVRWVLYPVSAVDEQGNCTTGSSITSNSMDRTAGGTGVVYSFQESGWHYLSCDFSDYKGAEWNDNLYFMQFYISDRDGAAYKYNAKDHPNINGDFTVYIDDITVDYSSVIDDRDAPVFANITYAGGDMCDAAALNNNANLAYSAIDFGANVTEYAATNATGIDAASAKAYIDGNEIACEYANGIIGMKSTPVLTQGSHTVKFSICDNQGNYASIVRTFNVTVGDEANVKVVPHDAALDRILFGSLYYIDVVANNAENIKSVTTTLNLDSVNEWELDHMVAADGFDVAYSYDDADKILTLTITNNGSPLTGEQALVSIPVRVWELNNVGSSRGTWGKPVSEGEWTYSRFKSGNEYWWMAVEVRVQQGVVTFTDDTTETFTGEKVHCDTEAWAIQKFMVETQEGKDYKASWNGGHIHDSHAIEDKAPTCTEAGYTGRTYCDVCKSVVDWGTTVPATGHSYVNGVCDKCGAKLTGEAEGIYYIDGVKAQGWIEDSYYDDGAKLTGVQKIDGFYYNFGDEGVCEGKMKYTGAFTDADGIKYCALGVIKTGWQTIGEDYYYFSPANNVAVDGEQTINGITYVFENNILVKGQWVQRENGRQYMWAGRGHTAGWTTIDGETYLFDGNGYPKLGVLATRVPDGTHEMVYAFDNVTGAWVGEDYSGLFECKGDTYYVENGYVIAAGLVLVDGNYYYIASNLKAVKDCTYFISRTNDLLPAGEYEFDANGVMQVKQPEPEDVKDGIVAENGGLYYYKDGHLFQAGCVEIDGNYYYVKSGAVVLANTSYYCSNMNGLLPAGTYEFDENGVMILGQVEPEPVKDGIVAENGGLYYYKDGHLYQAGCVEINGSYYYVKSGAVVLANTSYYCSNMNGLLPAGTYEFDANGVMQMPEPEPAKNGIVAENGGLYYYKDGSLYQAGCIEIDGNYYYVKSGAVVLANTKYYCSNMNGLLPAGYYEFDENGVMQVTEPEPEPVKNGIVAENGGLFYYKDGHLYQAGCVKIDGNYYYAKSGAVVLANTEYYCSNMNSLLPAGWYVFDANGVMTAK